MKKRLVALTMSLVMALGVSTGVFANTIPKNSETRVKANEEVLYVDDGEGNLMKVLIIEYKDNNSKVKNPITRGIFPDYKVGTRRSYDVKVSNQALGAPSAGAGVVALTTAMKKKAVNAAAAAIAKKVGSKFIPGLGVASTILGLVSWGNGQLGYTGFEFTIDLVYSSVYLHKEGHDMYGWDITSASVDTYY